jgi:hypothetical protein
MSTLLLPLVLASNGIRHELLRLLCMRMHRKHFGTIVGTSIQCFFSPRRHASQCACTVVAQPLNSRCLAHPVSTSILESVPPPTEKAQRPYLPPSLTWYRLRLLMRTATDTQSAVDLERWSCAGVGYQSGGPYSTNGRFQHDLSAFVPHFYSSSALLPPPQQQHQHQYQQQQLQQQLYSMPPAPPASGHANGFGNGYGGSNGRWVWQGQRGSDPLRDPLGAPIARTYLKLLTEAQVRLYALCAHACCAATVC